MSPNQRPWYWRTCEGPQLEGLSQLESTVTLVPHSQKEMDTHCTDIPTKPQWQTQDECTPPSFFKDNSQKCAKQHWGPRL